MRTDSARSRLRRGSVLIVVLWVSIGLVSVALLFGHSMLMAFRGTDNDISGRQAEQAIEGAMRYAMAVVDRTTTPGAMPDFNDYYPSQKQYYLDLAAAEG